MREIYSSPELVAKVPVRDLLGSIHPVMSIFFAAAMVALGTRILDSSGNPTTLIIGFIAGAVAIVISLVFAKRSTRRKAEEQRLAAVRKEALDSLGVELTSSASFELWRRLDAPWVGGDELIAQVRGMRKTGVVEVSLHKRGDTYEVKAS